MFRQKQDRQRARVKAQNSKKNATAGFGSCSGTHRLQQVYLPTIAAAASAAFLPQITHSA